MSLIVTMFHLLFAHEKKYWPPLFTRVSELRLPAIPGQGTSEPPVSWMNFYICVFALEVDQIFKKVVMISYDTFMKIISHRIHGAGIYANMTGVY